MRSSLLRVVVLTWEYPPRIVGEMAYYAQSLCQELARHGFETHVVTYHDSLSGAREESGVVVHRVNNPIRTHLNVLTWALTLSTEFERVCADVHYDAGPVDLVDCHEWLSVPAAISLSKALCVPYIMTINSLEEQRSTNPDNPMSLAIRHFERLGISFSSAVIVRSTAMKELVQKLHRVSEPKVMYVPRDKAFGETVTNAYAKIGVQGQGLVKT